MKTLKLYSSLLFTLTLTLTSFVGCGNTDTAPPPDPNSGLTLGGGGGGGAGPNSTETSGGAVGFLIDTNQPTQPKCTVIFINSSYALTAAHCLQRGAPATRYQVSAMSPVVAPLMGTGVAQVYMHPNWDGDTSLVTRHLYALTSTGSEASPLETTPLYDIAVLQLLGPVPGSMTLPPGSVPVVGDRVSFSSVLFELDLNGERRSSENLVATDIQGSSFTSLMPSKTQNSSGGAAALISSSGVGGSGLVLIGVFAGGAPSLGAVYTRTDVHRTFISDVLNGITTGNYTVDHNNPTGPGETEPGGFNCAETSDGFCNYACEGDIDCGGSTPVKLSTFGTPCTTNAECASGVCLQFDERNTRCSAYCGGGNQANCPTNFVCRPAVSGNLVCGTPLTESGDLPPPPALKYFGSDCMNDAECSTGACINYQNERWCSERCMQSSDCPLSYVCEAVTGGRGCVPPREPQSGGASGSGSGSGSGGASGSGG